MMKEPEPIPPLMQVSPDGEMKIVECGGCKGEKYYDEFIPTHIANEDDGEDNSEKVMFLCKFKNHHYKEDMAAFFTESMTLINISWESFEKRCKAIDNDLES